MILLPGSKSKHGRKNVKLAIVAVIAAVVLGMGAVTAASFSGAPAQAANKFGGLGSAHEHGAFIVKLDGKVIDFSRPEYQVKSPYIHVENGIGTTLHKHAATVPFGEFLKSIKMNVINGCFVKDDGTRYCDQGEKKLRFFLNNQEQSASMILGYVLTDDDRFLILYGDESPEEVQAELQRVQTLPIFRT